MDHVIYSEREEGGESQCRQKSFWFKEFVVFELIRTNAIPFLAVDRNEHNERTSERTNERTNERTDERTNERTNERKYIFVQSKTHTREHNKISQDNKKHWDIVNLLTNLNKIIRLG